jgi:hypothetical protein
MSSNQSEQVFQKYLTEDAIDALSTLTDEQVDSELAKAKLRETISLGTDIEAPDRELNPHEIVATKQGGTSVKPANVELNVMDAAKAFTTGGLAVGSAFGMPILTYLAVLSIIIAGRDLAAEDLSTETAVVYSMVHQYGSDGGVTKKTLYQKSSVVEDYVDMPLTLSQDTVSTALDQLCRIEAARVTNENTGTDQRYIPEERCVFTWNLPD